MFGTVDTTVFSHGRIIIHPVWSKNSVGVEVLVSCQVVMHNGLNSQPTVWAEQCRCPSKPA